MSTVITATYTLAPRSPNICVGSVNPRHVETARLPGMTGIWTTCDRCGYQPWLNSSAECEEIVAAPHPKRYPGR